MAKKATAKKHTPAPVESIRHKDTRKNIPTEELRDFVTEDEHAPNTMLYPRDPSLDPQLVWKGKDEQDRADLAVPVVPIYIQEKIHPQAIIDDLARNLPRPPGEGRGEGSQQLDLFADFNGLDGDFDRKVEFYQHDQHWSNRMILGDSLLVMTSLAEKEGLKGKVQTIYFDPPYGIKFGSNWQVSTRKRDVKDGKAEDTTRQPEQVRAFRDTWKLGIHSYLAYLRDRLVAARELLTDSGSVFVQIGDENVHLVRCILDEVFGSQSFIAAIAVTKTTGLGTAHTIPSRFDYLLWYGKRPDETKLRLLYEVSDADISGYNLSEVDANGVERRFMSDNLTKPGPGQKYKVEFNGQSYSSGSRWWGIPPQSMDTLRHAHRLLATKKTLRFKRYWNDFGYKSITNLWDGIAGAKDPIYVVQTNVEVVKRCLLMATDPGDLVLDPTCGSGTTAYVAEQWGRRWITCDTSRVSLALARTRLMAASFPYYYLAEEYPRLPNLIADEDIKAYLRKSASAPEKSSADIRKGFIYKRVPHVTLKSIANNPDIREGMTLVDVDAAIARHAETETLFDQPYEDSKRLRVSGPFTFESLSPHRTISVEDKKRLAEVGVSSGVTVKVVGPSNFATMILENLRKAGVQNTVKGERLKFYSLEPYAGEWIHGEGRYSESDGTPKRAAICIGPEHGTVGAQLVKEAAKEAVKGVGFDILIVCGFAFDPSVSEEAKRYGKLTVVAARMNPDLAMGDELLKKTGAGNLFMVFGEPDLEIRTQGDGQFIAEIKGVDVYDPTTGEIRSSSTDDIACWFIDTEYNGESFFVRHAYFTGADEPYDKLKRSLRAEIDEDAWSSLYTTTSRPFPQPQGTGETPGKIAVKVINHYGDEVMKVFNI